MGGDEVQPGAAADGLRMIGLWAIHRGMREARESGSQWRWWSDDIVEVERAFRMGRLRIIPCGYSRSIYTNAFKVEACARRWVRRFGGVRTVADWNALLRRIMRKGRMEHPSTERSCLLSERLYRPKSPVRFDESFFRARWEWVPRIRFTAYEVDRRAARLREAREARLHRERLDAAVRRAEAEIQLRRRHRRAFREISDAENDLRQMKAAIRAAELSLRRATQ